MKTTYDAIVIGAGVLGASAAAHLAEAGHSVLILERGETVSGASGGNLGQISISDRTESWHMPLALRSQDYYREVLSKEYPIEYVPSGGSVTLTGEEQIAAGQDAQRRMAAFGVESVIYWGEDIRKAEPGLSLNAADALLFCPAEGKLNPLQTTLAFLDKAQKSGAILLRRTPVTAFQKEGTHITGVETPASVFSAKWVVNCAGPQAAFIGKLAGVSLPIRFHKGTAFVSEPVGPVIRGPIVGGGFFLAPPKVRPRRSIGFGCVQTADGSILIAQSTEECEAGDRSVNMPSLQLVALRFLQYYPQMRDLRIVRAWAAATTYTEDDLPVFGFSAGADNLFTAAGFKGAFTTAPEVGRVTLETLEGRADQVFAVCSPDRAGT
ncbi:FAD-binding oxidoreductase [uncultured Oscillibacter sp.]|uniref:NAD(P)/FAD-dependent oxidoreductase n=1 Tax=uncultured Oscillibacter sp. TaxID=876091 RepID=UPI00262AE5E1|nr:FAD-binding oxidoreductase [uncultured Oscillibacter sp.]